MSEVEQVPGGQVSAELVVSHRRAADPIGAEGQDVGHPALGELLGEVVVGTRSGEDQAVHAAVQKSLRSETVGSGLVVDGRHDREPARALAGVGEGLAQHGHHGVGEPRDDDAHRHGLPPPEVGR